ncbi:hypothetical protein CRUP_032273 [Coryphaenoides rupestris]|nr:hypothetical protein CRUP_032273 [Coryphaenoides rupestris]
MFRGAASVGEQEAVPAKCVDVRCHGYENSLAECHIQPPQEVPHPFLVATVTCYPQRDGAPALGASASGCASSEFQCVNKKCVSLNQTCNGIDDCGDRSDEMCCKACRSPGFFCKPGVCVSGDAIHDNIRDCLDGKDEAPHTPRGPRPDVPATAVRQDRVFLESKLECGVPNASVASVVTQRIPRVKRVIGGVPAGPTQIQWQVVLEERSKVHCAGAYIGGCWVVTAAHCVGSSPSNFRVKFSIWQLNPQSTTDIVPVRNIIVHPRFNISTYENDIALVQLELLPPHDDVCLEKNPAVTAMFTTPHSCSISGWGRTSERRGSSVLLWANVSLISDCERFYKDRFHPGMMCAGDLEGHVDLCQGDSGGPLVCEDEMGVSYLWGIVSWGSACGKAGFPRVYTEVAHYFEWIRYHTGWQADPLEYQMKHVNSAPATDDTAEPAPATDDTAEPAPATDDTAEPAPASADTTAEPTPASANTTAEPTPATAAPRVTDNYLGPTECLDKLHTRKSCDRMFCPPWQRCVDNVCLCKLPYLCPSKGVRRVCGADHRMYMSYCQVMARSCSVKKAIMSHFGEQCNSRVSKFSSALHGAVVRVSLPPQAESVFVCPGTWNMAAANVMCRTHNYPLGAASVGEQEAVPAKCVEVRCHGYENSLAECHIQPPQEVPHPFLVATVTCYPQRDGASASGCASSEFQCVNKKCVSLNQTCNGIDDCGDRSDEMCCKACRSPGFFCKPGVCVSGDAIHDNIRDCLDGKDEAQHTPRGPRPDVPATGLYRHGNTAATADSNSPKDAVRQDRVYLESKLECGVPNASVASVVTQRIPRVKRVIGGVPAEPKNPAVTAVCLPWSTQMFTTPHSCSISGWGRTSERGGSSVLLWANVSLISDCERFYKDRFHPGMMCAGDLEGHVDSCQGDSGGPLVCEDEMGVSYLWGIVSWGSACGKAGFPGVYTEVAHYFEWIRYHIGWQAVTKYNS